MVRQRSFLFLLSVLIAATFLSCSYKYKITVNPEDSSLTANGIHLKNNELLKTRDKALTVTCKRRGYSDYKESIANNNPFLVKKINIKLDKEKYAVKINTIEGNSDVYLDGVKIGTTPFTHDFEYGIYDLVLKRKDYADQTVRLEAKSNCTLSYSHKKDHIILEQVGVFPCGDQPKQVIYSPDDKYIFIILLNGDGFQVFNTDTFKMDYYIKPPDKKRHRGFPEGLFIPEKNAFLVSQMTTGLIYEYSYPGLEYRRTINTKGIWSKFMAWSHDLQVVAVSNWETNNISIIDYSKGDVLKLIKTSPSPRGLAFTKDGKYLYATTFDGGEIYKIDTRTWKIKNRISRKNSAMRHVELSNDEKTAYVSDMYYSEVYVINTDSFKIEHTYKVDRNPNTIALTPDNKWLLVSSRGPNDPETYLTRSPRNGRNTIIDLTNQKIAGYIEGGNQPTGLGVSNDGNYACFSNFRDDNIEIYWLGELKK